MVNRWQLIGIPMASTIQRIVSDAYRLSYRLRPRGIGAWGYSSEYDPKVPELYGDRLPLTLSKRTNATLVTLFRNSTPLVRRCGLWYNGLEMGALLWHVDSHARCAVYGDCALPNGVFELRTDGDERVGAVVVVQCHVPILLVGSTNQPMDGPSDGFRCDRSIAFPREYASEAQSVTVAEVPQYVGIVGVEPIETDLTIWYGQRSVGFILPHGGTAVVEQAFGRGYLRLYHGKVLVGWIVLWDALCCGWVLLNGLEKDTFPIDKSLVQWNW